MDGALRGEREIVHARVVCWRERWCALIVAAGLTGCADPGACSAPPEQCLEGFSFGSCGGDAPPVLACGG
jgi:hypothetical protein